MIKSYKELTVWQKSIELVIEIYELTKKFPNEEIYGLTSQIRRASVSIPSNISEGFSRRHRKEYSQFIRIAFGSGAELETQIIISKKLKYANEKEYETIDSLLVEIMKMLNSLNSALVAKS
jgi:four helix bundle protein